MTDQQWQDLLKMIRGSKPENIPVGFIIDSPWLPGWAGISTLQYYTSGKKWFAVNKKAVDTFPDMTFLPGFWSEFGMCTEPSAFGSRLIWNETSLPFAEKVIRNIRDITELPKPNPGTDGLLPFVMQRLKEYHPSVRKAGHEIMFAVSRGPLNIASFMMGTTELMTAIIMNPEEIHRLLQTVTDFITDWLQLQKETFPSIDGIFVLDDIVGFVGESEFRTFVIPYLKKVFHAFDAKVRFFHNDAQGRITATHLKEIGINLFNFSYEHSINEIRTLAGPEVVLLGNLPPRDVLAGGTPEQVAGETRKMIERTEDKTRVIWSCGGGIPPEVSTENMNAFIKAVKTILI